MLENKFPGKDVTEEDLQSKIPLTAKKSPDHKSIVKAAGVEFGGSRIPTFAGPNAVESRDMIMRTAEELKKRGADFLRGGAFKPLTFPYRSEKYFELREEGLKYLDEAKREFGIPIITEIMHETKVKEVAEVADIMQVGARNMQNYPLLEEVAATGKAVMIKRHFGCSLRDWLGAAEYVLKAGNKNVILCERGVCVPHTHRATSRFLLDLQVVPAAQEITHLPVATDPSHATFWRPWVASMSLASVAAGADAVMLEVHPDPENAAVDPLQPIDFDAYSNLIERMEAVAQAIGRSVKSTASQAA